MLHFFYPWLAAERPFVLPGFTSPPSISTAHVAPFSALLREFPRQKNHPPFLSRGTALEQRSGGLPSPAVASFPRVTSPLHTRSLVYLFVILFFHSVISTCHFFLSFHLSFLHLFSSSYLFVRLFVTSLLFLRLFFSLFPFSSPLRYGSLR